MIPVIPFGPYPRRLAAAVTLSVVALTTLLPANVSAARKPPVKSVKAKYVKASRKPAPKAAAKKLRTVAAAPRPQPRPAARKVRILPVGFNAPARPSSMTALTGGTVEIVAAGKGRINYEAGLVKAVGLGAVGRPTLKKSRAQDVLEAREAAIADALRILGMTVSEVRVTSDTRVRNFLLARDDVRVNVRSFLRNAEIVEEKLVGEVGVYRVVMQARLTGPGSLMEALGPAVNPTLAAAHPKGEPLATPAPEPQPDPFAPGMPAPDRAEYTSLVVDCRGLGIVASMSPKLYDTSGREVYGTMKVSADYVNEVGIAAFPRSMEAARRCARAGARPLVVRAKKPADRHRFYVTISTRDAERARDANESSRFFERTAVIFLVDPI